MTKRAIENSRALTEGKEIFIMRKKAKRIFFVRNNNMYQCFIWSVPVTLSFSTLFPKVISTSTPSVPTKTKHDTNRLRPLSLLENWPFIPLAWRAFVKIVMMPIIKLKITTGKIIPLKRIWTIRETYFFFLFITSFFYYFAAFMIFDTMSPPPKTKKATPTAPSQIALFSRNCLFILILSEKGVRICVYSCWWNRDRYPVTRVNALSVVDR